MFDRWIGHLAKVADPVRKKGVEELLGVIPSVPYTWIQKTDSQLREQGANTQDLMDVQAGIQAEKDGLQRLAEWESE